MYILPPFIACATLVMLLQHLQIRAIKFNKFSPWIRSDILQSKFFLACNIFLASQLLSCVSHLNSWPQFFPFFLLITNARTKNTLGGYYARSTNCPILVILYLWVSWYGHFNKVIWLPPKLQAWKPTFWAISLDIKYISEVKFNLVLPQPWNVFSKVCWFQFFLILVCFSVNQTIRAVFVRKEKDHCLRMISLFLN